MQHQHAEELLNRLRSIGITSSSSINEIQSEKINANVKAVICELASKIAHFKTDDPSTQEAEEVLKNAKPETKQIEQALRQFEFRICGKGWVHASTPVVWQPPVERLIAHLQALILLDRQRGKNPTTPSSAAQAPSSKDLGLSTSGANILNDIAELMDCTRVSSQVEQLEQIKSSLDQMLQNVPEELSGSLIKKENLNEEQIAQLQKVYEAFKDDYATRREMLIERVKVTLQAMLWSKDWLEKQGTLEKAKQAADEGVKDLAIPSSVEFEDVFQATLDDIVSVTSRPVLQDKDKFRATVKDVFIGKVPDRGGRPMEGRAAAAQASMPEWTARSTSGSTARGNQQTRGRRGGSAGERGRHKHRGGGRYSYSLCPVCPISSEVPYCCLSLLPSNFRDLATTVDFPGDSSFDITI